MTNNSGGGGHGGTRPGAGRKPKDKTNADKRLMVRLTAEQWERLQRAALLSNLAPSELVRKWTSDILASCA